MRRTYFVQVEQIKVRSSDRATGHEPMPLNSLHRSASDGDARVPARRAPAWRWLDRFDIQTAAGDQPRDQGVRVPHLARPEFIAPPHRGGYRPHQLEDALRDLRIVRQSVRTCNGLSDIRDDAVAPAAQLIPKDLKEAGPAASNGSLCDDPADGVVAGSYGGRLDHVPGFTRPHDECRVVEVAARTPFERAPGHTRPGRAHRSRRRRAEIGHRQAHHLPARALGLLSQPVDRLEPGLQRSASTSRECTS